MVVHIPKALIVHHKILSQIGMNDVAVMVALVNQVADLTVYHTAFHIIRHLNILRLNGN